MKGNKVHIVGGGIVGLCSAWYLVKAGCDVTVIDEHDGLDGTSFGNSGMIVPSHFVPLASPGVVAKGLKWMFDSKSPFYIRPRLNTDLFQWLWHFYRSCNAQHVEDSMSVLYALNEKSKVLYKEIAAENGFDFSFQERGLLMLYKTRKQAEEEEELAEKAHQLGIEARVLDNAGLKALEPEMEMDVLGGVHYPGDADLHPNQFMTEISAHLKQLGVVFLRNTAVVDFKTRGSKIEALIANSREVIPVENVLLATGSWTALVLKKLGVKIHLQDGKGYSITLHKPGLRPRVPTILSEAKVAVAPMGDDLRIGGTLEISGLSAKVNPKRVQGIIESVPRYYKNLEVPFSDESPIWKGYRPCTPDGMPYIGQSEELTNLFVGTGHGMMGLSLGAITGKLLSEIMTGEEPELGWNRFG